MGITHEWSGTTLIITSDSGTSSCDLKGEKGDTGCRGPQGKAGVISDGDSVNIDLSDYALKSEVPTNTSELTNDSGYITSIPSEYITETELNNKGYITSIPSDYVTETELNNKGYLTNNDLGDYAKTADIPTKVSQLTNDKNYLTSVPSEYITSTELNSKGYLTNNDLVAKDYVTNTQLDNKDYLTRDDMSAYYTELEVDNLLTHVRKDIPTKTSQLYNDSGYIKASDLETGEATWDSIKGYILDTIEVPIEWDGNTEGLETHPKYTAFYKVSDIVMSAEEAEGAVYYDYCIDNSITSDFTIPPVGNGWLATMVDGGAWFTLSGVMCVYGDDAGCSKGMYFYKGTWDDGTEKIHYINKLVLNDKQIKEDYLPENIGGDSVEIPFFDLAAMGLPAASPNNSLVSVNTDTTEIMRALDNGQVTFNILISMGDTPIPITICGSVAKLDTTYQIGMIGWYSYVFFSINIIVFDGTIQAVLDLLYTLNMPT